jgi:hypothetical protein
MRANSAAAAAAASRLRLAEASASAAFFCLYAMSLDRLYSSLRMRISMEVTSARLVENLLPASSAMSRHTAKRGRGAERVVHRLEGAALL